jgi:hypothetical protein
MARRIQSFAPLSAAMLLLCALVGCIEIGTSVKVQNGPKFRLAGSGRLASFKLFAPRPGRRIATPFDAQSIVWQLQASGGYFDGAAVQHLLLEPGQVPPGYEQTKPEGGAAPVLSSGLIYYFFAETTNAPPAEGFFYFDQGTPTEIRVPGLCQSGFAGDVQPLQCRTDKPFVEPTNLVAFVRQNRVSQ